MTGETLVLLHGFTGAPSSWDAVRAALPAHLEVHTPALLGHGDAPRGATGWQDEIDRVAVMVSELGGHVHLAGYSMGGRVALGVLARHPEIAVRATLIGAGAGIDDPQLRATRREDDEHRARSIESDGVDAFVQVWEREPIFETQRALSTEQRAHHRSIRSAHSAAGLAASLRVLGQGAMPSLWDELPRITVPCTLVAGSEDAKLRAVALRMAERLPRARVEIVPGAGHDVGLERPVELARILAQEETS